MSKKNKNILVTGAAGFIGYHLSEALVKEGHHVVGLDNISGYYDISLKLARLDQLGIDEHNISEGAYTQSASHDNFVFFKADLKDRAAIPEIFRERGFDIVVNLAAQAGVRYSVENPSVYIDANIQGFANILEACRKYPVEHLVYASSSSVYGSNAKMPFSVSDNVDHPLSLYAASKKSNELMAHAYSHLFSIPTTGLRFFTVYGPWGRPDMALFLFADAIVKDKKIKVFNNGEMSRDFTYVTDVVQGIVKVINKPAQENKDWDAHNPDPAYSTAPYAIYNIGSHSPVKLMDFVQVLEEALGKEAKKEFMPMQPGDVPATYADISDLEREFNYKPATSVEEGVGKFVDWYKTYYSVD